MFGDIRNPAVTDCCGVSITGKILNGIPISFKSFFDERTPFLFIEGIYEFLPVVMVTQICTFYIQRKPMLFVIKFEFSINLPRNIFPTAPSGRRNPLWQDSIN